MIGGNHRRIPGVLAIGSRTAYVGGGHKGGRRDGPMAKNGTNGTVWVCNQSASRIARNSFPPIIIIIVSAVLHTQIFVNTYAHPLNYHDESLEYKLYSIRKIPPGLILGGAP